MTPQLHEAKRNIFVGLSKYFRKQKSEPAVPPLHLERPLVARITFRYVLEFTDEMMQNPPNVEPIVRYDEERTPGEISSDTSITAVASYLRQTGAVLQIFTLREHVGKTWKGDSKLLAEARAQQCFNLIKQAAVHCGIVVRPGHYDFLNSSTQIQQPL